jgi:hypothetical protein
VGGYFVNYLNSISEIKMLSENQRLALDKGRQIAHSNKKARLHFRLAKERLKEKEVKLTGLEKWDCGELGVEDKEKYHDLTNMGEDELRGWARKRGIGRRRKQHVVSDLYDLVCPYCFSKGFEDIAQWVKITAQRYRMIQTCLSKDISWTEKTVEEVKLRKPYCCKKCWSQACQAFRRSGKLSWIEYVSAGVSCKKEVSNRKELIRKANFSCCNCRKKVSPWQASDKLVLVDDKVYCRKCMWNLGLVKTLIKKGK